MERNRRVKKLAWIRHLLIPSGISQFFLFRDAPVIEVCVQTVLIGFDCIHQCDSQALCKFPEVSHRRNLIANQD